MAVLLLPVDVNRTDLQVFQHSSEYSILNPIPRRAQVPFTKVAKIRSERKEPRTHDGVPFLPVTHHTRPLRLHLQSLPLPLFLHFFVLFLPFNLKHPRPALLQAPPNPPPDNPINARIVRVPPLPPLRVFPHPANDNFAPPLSRSGPPPLERVGVNAVSGVRGRGGESVRPG